MPDHCRPVSRSSRTLCWGELPCWAVLIWFLMMMCQTGCDKGAPTQSGATSEASAHLSTAGLVPLTNMVFIKAGTFHRIKYPVTLTHDFLLSKYEVTQGEFMALMGRNPSHFQGDTNRPVEKLSFFDAVAYCQELTRRERQAGHLPAGYEYRLPSEAEWEYACRAGTTNFFSFGDFATNAGEYAWTLENSDGTSHPVGQKRPNPWGLYDMHGNVWEWCQDWWADNLPGGIVVDQQGPGAGSL